MPLRISVRSNKYGGSISGSGVFAFFGDALSGTRSFGLDGFLGTLVPVEVVIDFLTTRGGPANKG